MVTDRKSSKATGTHRAPSRPDGAVRVWSSVGITVAITDDPPQFLKLEFGHERLARNDTTEELRRVARLIDEFNEAEIEKRVEQYTRLIRRHGVEVEEDVTPRKGSVSDRARKRLRKMQEDDALDQAEEDTWD